jgi:hypothetical protein
MFLRPLLGPVLGCALQPVLLNPTVWDFSLHGVCCPPRVDVWLTG